MPKMITGQTYTNRGGALWRVVDTENGGDYPVTARAVDGDGVIRATHMGKVGLQGTDDLDLVTKTDAPAKSKKSSKAEKVKRAQKVVKNAKKGKKGFGARGR